MVQWFTMKTTNNKINLLCNILDILWHSTKLNINLKKIAENIFSCFFLSGRAYSEEQHSSINGFAEALLLQQMKIENTRGKIERGGKKKKNKS